MGVFCLLAQCGWDVPARDDTQLPLVGRLLADLGDDQSIAEALSSFSAHLKHLRRFMDEAGPDTLVICDEIGTGTDPHEGTALGFSVLEELVDRGALVLASTHYGLLKVAVHDHPRMVNAAMDYDERDLQPLFTFRVGDPGTSHAFDIAARMGFSAPLLQRARAMAGEERVQVEKLLSDLDRRARQLADEQKALALEKDRLTVANQELDRRLKGLDREKRDAVQAARRRADEMVQQGRRDIEKAVREIRSEGGGQAGGQGGSHPAGGYPAEPGKRVRRSRRRRRSCRHPGGRHAGAHPPSGAEGAHRRGARQQDHRLGGGHEADPWGRKRCVP